MTEQSIPNTIHIIGAGGAGMSGLGKLLSQLGHTVSGSDVKPGPMLDGLRDVGVDVWIGHRPEAIEGVELVVASSAVPDRDPELAAAKKLNVPVWRRPRLLQALSERMDTVGLAGTHGKTTSTALMITALRGMGLDPSFLVGGRLVDLNTGSHLGSDPTFVLEADEAFGTFRHLSMSSIMVTNIEADHLDHYGTLAALEDAFAQVVESVPGPRVACIDDPGVRRLAARADVHGYGFSESAEWRISNMRHVDGGAAFTVTGPGHTHEVQLPKPGVHLARNATGVLALIEQLGLDGAAAAEALGSFQGVRRRYEVAARVGGVTIVDDYAHHPTEVAATISAAREGSDGRVHVVFQPHRYTRTADLAPHFGEPLAAADSVFVTDVYAAGETPIIGVSGRLVAQACSAAGTDAEYIPRLAGLAAPVASVAEPGDVVLLLGAGDVNSIVRDIAERIRTS